MKKLSNFLNENKKTPKINHDELRVGTEVEMEHTSDEDEAIDIATDHLKENPKYYSELVKSGLVDEEPALVIANELGWEIGEEVSEKKVIQTKKIKNSAKVIRETTEELFGKDGKHRALADKLFVVFKKELRRKATDLGAPIGQVRDWKIVLRDYDNKDVNTTVNGKPIK